MQMTGLAVMREALRACGRICTLHPHNAAAICASPIALVWSRITATWSEATLYREVRELLQLNFLAR
jgi:hypothetical protein